jgi:hypothetical protein
MTQTAELYVHEQSMHYLASTAIGRVVVSNHDDVVVIPVSYVAESDCIVFQISATWRKQVVECDQFVFHADGIDTTTGIGWSVTVRGKYSMMSGYGSVAPPVGFTAASSVWQQDNEEASIWFRLRTDIVDIRESMKAAG